MSERDDMVARAIYDATEPLSGDHISTVLVASDHLFPNHEHLEGNSTSKAYQLAAMDVCRTIARVAIEAMRTEPAVWRWRRSSAEPWAFSSDIEPEKWRAAGFECEPLFALNTGKEE